MSACDRYSPKDSLSGAVNYICNYLKEHPGWSREDIVKLIEELQKEDFVNSFNGRSGDVTLVSSDVNNLEIASAYFALTENVDDLNITELYENGVRLIFAGYDRIAQHYTELYGLNKHGGLVHKEVINTGGQEISYPVTSVNGKTGAVRLKLDDVLIDKAASAQVWMGTKVTFDSTVVNTWNTLYKAGYRLAVVVDDQHENVTGLYVLNQGSGQVNNTPIPVQLGGGGEPVDPNLVEQVQKNTEAIGAINDEMPRKYSPTNEPPYPVRSVNGDSGDIYVKKICSPDVKSYMTILEYENFVRPFFSNAKGVNIGGLSLEPSGGIFPNFALIDANSTALDPIQSKNNGHFNEIRIKYDEVSDTVININFKLGDCIILSGDGTLPEGNDSGIMITFTSSSIPSTAFTIRSSAPGLLVSCSYHDPIENRSTLAIRKKSIWQANNLTDAIFLYNMYGDLTVYKVFNYLT